MRERERKDRLKLGLILRNLYYFIWEAKRNTDKL